MIRSHLEYLDSIKTHSKGVFFPYLQLPEGILQIIRRPHFLLRLQSPKLGRRHGAFFGAPGPRHVTECGGGGTRCATQRRIKGGGETMEKSLEKDGQNPWKNTINGG